jgi:acetoin:2,6-dichlorophenolindophenol oxidoreductase subunit alpha
MTQPNNSQRLWMYEQMLTSRYMEESIERIYMEGKTPVFNMAKGPIPGEMHLSNGQEPCAVGVCAHLKPADIVTATHRPHHIAVAKGVDLNEMMAEIFGKATGLSGGRGGHMHLFDGRVNFSCSGIIAEGMGPAVGAALSRQMQGKPGVAVSFIGEGAANQGAFHETLNLAALWKLPVVFVIEDNAWGISVAKASATCIAQHHVRAAAYGMPGVFVENNDPDGVFRAAGEAIEREKDGLMKKDPIPGYRQRLIDEGVMSEAQAEDIAARARGRIDEAVQFARESPYPRPEEALEQVFV